MGRDRWAQNEQGEWVAPEWVAVEAREVEEYEANELWDELADEPALPYNAELDAHPVSLTGWDVIDTATD
jgi:hypothetical protein